MENSNAKPQSGLAQEDRVVIQISPHTEIISAPPRDERQNAPLPGAESSYAADAARAEQNGSGDGAVTESQSVFAKMLAGLLGKDRSETAVNLDSDVSLAVDAGAVTDVPGDTEAEAAAGVSGAEKNKNRRAGKTQVAELAEGEKSPAADKDAGNELSKTKFPDDEQSPLFGVELLLSRSTEQAATLGEVSLEGESGVSGEIARAEGASLDEAASLFAGQDMAAEASAAAAENSGEAVRNGVEREKAAKDRFSSLMADPASDAEVLAGGEKLTLADMAKQAEQGKNGRSEKGRLEEARGRDRRRDRFSLELRDLRSGAENGGKAGELRFAANAETRAAGGGGTREITLELRLPDYAQDMPGTETAAGAGANAGWELKSGQAVEDLLARELHQNFNGDIVRHASMALRDEGEGTIKLALKPESLGNVKIRLEMAENKITGHIVVESEEALRAFEREVHSLEQAFRDSGFSAANLQMSLASDNRGAEGQWQEAGSFVFGEQAASRYDASLDRLEPRMAVIDLYQRGTALINVLA